MSASQILPNKKLGQNFLIQKSAIHLITRKVLDCNTDSILEIGPGKGALTEILVLDGRTVWAIDLDSRLINLLSNNFKNHTNINLILGDAIKMPLDIFEGTISIVGNLPYNVATTILTRFLLTPVDWKQMVFMFQLEVGRKIMAQPRDHDYGPLSIMAQIICDIEKLIQLGPKSFVPEPKVDSIALVFKPKKNQLAYQQRTNFLKFLHMSFLHRRKTLVNNWRGCISNEHICNIFALTKLAPNIRAEELSPETWLNIFNVKSLCR